MHGYNYQDTPLWAGIYLLPLTIGFLVAGPVSGLGLGPDRLALARDRRPARHGCVVRRPDLPADRLHLLAVRGADRDQRHRVGPVRRAQHDGDHELACRPASAAAASGMRGTFFNSGSSLSIGIFFSLMIAGLASTLPTTLTNGLTAQGVPAATAQQIGGLPPVGSLFAAFLGYNPMQSLLGPTGALQQIPAANAAKLTGKEFFPQLISQPFHHGLVVVFTAAALMMLIGAIASLFRGGKYVHDDGALSQPRRRRPDGRGRPGRAAEVRSWPPTTAAPAGACGPPANQATRVYVALGRLTRALRRESRGTPVSHGVLSALVTWSRRGRCARGELAAREGWHRRR